MHADDQTLDDLERRALAAFAAAEPPEDFADRIVALAAAATEASEASAASEAAASEAESATRDAACASGLRCRCEQRHHRAAPCRAPSPPPP